MARPKKTPRTPAKLADTPANSARDSLERNGRAHLAPVSVDANTPEGSASTFRYALAEPAAVPSSPSRAPGVLSSVELAGIRCRKCGCADLPVAYVRHLNGYTQRVRFCRHCGRRIVTREAEA